MKDTPTTSAIEDVIKAKLDAVDAFIEELVAPLEAVGNPENLIGKPYTNWTPEDLQRLTTIYGSDPKSPLQKFIFNREYQHLRDLEQGV